MAKKKSSRLVSTSLPSRSGVENAAQPSAPLLTPAQAAAILGVSVGTLEVWRSSKRYPLVYIKIGVRVMYRASDVDRFIDSRAVTPVDTAIAR